MLSHINIAFQFILVSLNLSVSFSKYKSYEYTNVIVGSQIVAHTQMETGDGPNKPNTINL